MKNFNQYSVNKEAMTAEAGPGVGGSVLMKALYKEHLFFQRGIARAFILVDTCFKVAMVGMAE